MDGIGSSPSSLLFDRHLLRKRRRGISPLPHHPLNQWVARHVAWRLSLIRTSFSRGLLLGDLSPETLAQSLPFSSLSRLDSFSLRGQEDIIVFDSETLPFQNNCFDFIVSFLDMHLMNDVPGFLSQVYRCLRINGYFLGVCWGENTLWQLRHAASWADEQVYGAPSPRVAPMMGIRLLAQLMERGRFDKAVVDREQTTLSFPNIKSLLHLCKLLGETNVLIHRFKGLGQKRFLSALRAYGSEGISPPGGSYSLTALFASGWKGEA